MSRVDEINKELTLLMKADDGNYNFERMEQLIEEKEILEPEKSLTLHYEESIPIGQIQLAAKVARAWLTKDPYRNNLNLVDCPIPIELKGDWTQLEALADKYGKRLFFYIETPNYGILRYVLKRSRQISDIEANLHLAGAQTTLQKIRNDVENFDIQDADSLADSFVLINSALSQFFFIQADENGTFDWAEKYSPCFFDRKRILDFRGRMMPEIQLEVDQKKLALCRKYFMRDFAMLTKYLTFWVSLLDVTTFPCLPTEYKEVYNNWIDYLLKNYANIYIYDIVAESNIVKNSGSTNTRGSESNTTRVKIFFTQSDDKPQLLRLDLPHVDHPYVHINHQDAEGNINNHIRLSSDVADGTLDNVFEPLIETLQCYNFFTIDTRYSPASDDKAFIHEMRYLTAMYSYAIVAHAYLYLGYDSEIYKMPEVKLWRIELIKLLSTDGYSPEETCKLDPWSLFEFADTLMK